MGVDGDGELFVRVPVHEDRPAEGPDVHLDANWVGTLALGTTGVTAPFGEWSEPSELD